MVRRSACPVESRLLSDGVILLCSPANYPINNMFRHPNRHRNQNQTQTQNPRDADAWQELTEVGEVVADGEEELAKVANMAKSVSGGRSGGGSGPTDGKPKKDRRTTMLGRFRRPKAAAAAQGDGGAGGDGGGGGVETNAALANYITSKKDKKVRAARVYRIRHKIPPLDQRQCSELDYSTARKVTVPRSAALMRSCRRMSENVSFGESPFVEETTVHIKIYSCGPR